MISLFHSFLLFLKVIIVILGVFTVLATVFDIDITALAAGLGVGGIAIAMASKEKVWKIIWFIYYFR